MVQILAEYSRCDGYHYDLLISGIKRDLNFCGGKPSDEELNETILRVQSQMLDEIESKHLSNGEEI